MEAYRVAYRDPRSPLTPLAPMDSNMFTFSATPDTANYKKANSLAPSAIPTRPKPGSSQIVKSQVKKKITYCDQDGVVTTSYSKTTLKKQVYKTDNVMGKYNLSPCNTKKATCPRAPTLRAQVPATQMRCRALATCPQAKKTLRNPEAGSKAHVAVCTPRKVTVFAPPNSPFAALPLSPRVERILKQTGMCRYAPLFELEEIDYEIFKSLCEEDLIELGIECQVDRDVIMSAVRYWSHFC